MAQGTISPPLRQPAGFSVARREIIAMIAGPLLYAGLSWTTNVFHMQAAADMQIRPAVAVPVFFGFVFGPVVGFVTGAAGNFFGDSLSGLLPYRAATPMGNPVIDWLRAYLINWQIGNGLMGLIPGIAAMYYRRYFSLSDQLRAVLFAVLGVLIGIGFAAFGHTFVDTAVDLGIAFNSFFVPLVKVNLLNAVIIVPILLFNYERFDVTSTEWTQSGLMRQLLMAILVSAALPIALLGLFLTQQATGASQDSTELWGKLGFTVLLSLLFTLANAGLVAQSMSRPLLRLTDAAKQMQGGQLNRRNAADLEATEGQDEIGQLSRVFGRMALEVIGREEALRAEVAQLRIEIDESKKARQVEEIVESDYFRDLQAKARQLREKRSN
jgi:energy-coupling factor transport system substrate-specific component